jgi:hypothetical protein
MTSLGDLPDPYAFFKSLKSSEFAVMLKSRYRSPLGSVRPRTYFMPYTSTSGGGC